MFSTWHHVVVRHSSGASVIALMVGMLVCIACFEFRKSLMLGKPTPDSPTAALSTAKHVMARLSDLGDAGRKLYAATQLTLDAAFPILYVGFFALFTRLCWRHDSPWISALPLIAGIADLLENVTARHLALNWQEGAQPPLATITAIATNVKFAFLLLSALFASIGVVVWACRWWRGAQG